MGAAASYSNIPSVTREINRNTSEGRMHPKARSDPASQSPHSRRRKATTWAFFSVLNLSFQDQTSAGRTYAILAQERHSLNGGPVGALPTHRAGLCKSAKSASHILLMERQTEAEEGAFVTGHWLAPSLPYSEAMEVQTPPHDRDRQRMILFYRE